MKLHDVSFAIIMIAVVVMAVAIKATGFHDSAHRLAGWSVGLFTGMFIGAFAVWAGARVDAAAERGRKAQRDGG